MKRSGLLGLLVIFMLLQLSAYTAFAKADSSAKSDSKNVLFIANWLVLN